MTKQPLEQSLYHSLLRIGAVTMAIVLVFDSGLLFKGSADLSSSTQQYLANAVGVSVGVTPTEVNQLTGRITELEQELATEREIAVSLSSDSAPATDRSTFILSIILFILLVLIVLNYALDYVRAHAPRQKFDTPNSGPV